MANAIDHLRLASKCQATLSFLLGDHRSHPEWIAVIAFYKAVNVVEAVFDATSGYHSSDHSSRLERLLRLNTSIYKPFNTLLGKSRLARYLADSKTSCSDFAAHISADEVVRVLVGKKLLSVEQQCIALLPKEILPELVQLNKADLPAKDVLPPA